MTAAATLQAAVEAGDAAEVRRLLERGLDPLTLHPEEGVPVYYTAIDEASEAVVEAFLDAGVDVNHTDECNFFALRWALWRDDGLALARRLLDRGADVDHFDLHPDLERQGSVLVKLLHDEAPRLDEAVALLLTRGADPSRPCTEGWTPLMLAARNNHLGAARLLLDHGADLDATKGRGVHLSTALELARYGDHADMVALLLARGAAELDLRADMRVLIDDLIAAVQATAPGRFDHLSAPPQGAAKADLDALETDLGRRLPAALRAFLLLCGGAPSSRWALPLLQDHRLLSLPEIRALRETLRAQCADRALETPSIDRRSQGGIRPVWWSPRWVPLTISEADPEHHLLDLDPLDDSHREKIILWSFVEGPLHRSAWSFADLLEHLRDLLRSGTAVRFDEDYGYLRRG